MKKRSAFCKHCKKKINFQKDKYVLIGTYNCEKVKEENYFHFNCFVEWYNKQVSAKAKNSIKEMQEKAQGLFSQLQSSGFLSGVTGIGKLKNILGKDLNLSNLSNIAEIFAEKPKPKKKTHGKTKTKKRNKM